MKRHFLHLIYIYVLTGVAFATLVGCCKDEEETWDKPKKTLDRTLIFYMAGENSLSRFIEEDSAEIANGIASLPENCRAVMYIDDLKSSRLCVGIHGHDVETVKTYDRNVCSTDSADMEEVLNDIFNLYPAKSYGLVLWSHASGWVFDKDQQSAQSKPRNVRRRTFGIDNGNRTSSNTGREMELHTLTNILAHHPHLEFIFCDACFMQCIEVAYELRNVTDWILGSPAEIPGNGAPYTQLMIAMGEPEFQPLRLLEEYYDYYVNGAGAQQFKGAILSAIKTSELPQLAAATRPLVQRLFANRNVLDCSGVQRYYPLVNSEEFTEFYDMAGIFGKHLPVDEYELWWEVLSEAVQYRLISDLWTSSYSSLPLRVYDPENCAAVSMFVPTAFYDALGLVERYHSLEWYKAVGMNETGW